MAYRSNETGRFEIYVRTFPDVDVGKWQISKDGGSSPVWRPDGRELFYRTGDAMMVVSIDAKPNFTAGNPEVLFTGEYYSGPGRHYDVASDGRLLMLKEAEQTEEISARTQFIVVQNWFEEFEDLLPSGR